MCIVRQVYKLAHVHSASMYTVMRVLARQYCQLAAAQHTVALHTQHERYSKGCALWQLHVAVSGTMLESHLMQVSGSSSCITLAVCLQHAA